MRNFLERSASVPVSIPTTFIVSTSSTGLSGTVIFTRVVVSKDSGSGTTCWRLGRV